jgi:hypothetical protein
MIAPKHHDRANDRYDHTPDVEAGYALRAERAEQNSSDNRAHDADGDIEPEALAALVDYLTANEARDETQYKPAYNSHLISPPTD